jgi:ATP-dependent Clp protease, protease subunit
MHIVPTIIEKSFNHERVYDVYSKLLEERIILLTGEINDDMASSIIASLLLLESKDSESDIYMYINSPGGSIHAGLAIYDTMNFISNDVSTICVGLAASMGAFLLSGGAKNKRFALPNSEIMIHQPLGQSGGQASDMEIAAKRIIYQKEKLNKLLALHTHQPLQKIQHDTDRDYYMNAKEALDYGIIDDIIQRKD